VIQRFVRNYIRLSLDVVVNLWHVCLSFVVLGLSSRWLLNLILVATYRGIPYDNSVAFDRRTVTPEIFARHVLIIHDLALCFPRLIRACVSSIVCLPHQPGFIWPAHGYFLLFSVVVTWFIAAIGNWSWILSTYVFRLPNVFSFRSFAQFGSSERGRIFPGHSLFFRCYWW